MIDPNNEMSCDLCGCDLSDGFDSEEAMDSRDLYGALMCETCYAENEA